MIKVLQMTQVFEKRLVEKFKPGGNREEVVFEGQDGGIEIEVGDADEIREKYKEDKPSAEESGFGFDNGRTKRKGRTKISAHIYRFDNIISECFEPYLQRYAETEEGKIADTLKSVMASD